MDVANLEQSLSLCQHCLNVLLFGLLLLLLLFKTLAVTLQFESPLLLKLPSLPLLLQQDLKLMVLVTTQRVQSGSDHVASDGLEGRKVLCQGSSTVWLLQSVLLHLVGRLRIDCHGDLVRTGRCCRYYRHG